MRPDPVLQTSLAGLHLRTPIIAASGTAGYAHELAGVADLGALGAIVAKSVTVEPRDGNPVTRILPRRAGMMNAIGLANMGVDRFLEEVTPRVRGVDTPVFGSVAGGGIDEYVRIAAALDACEALPAIELNVSCPNTDDGRQFGDDPALLRELIGAARAVVSRSVLIVKLPPHTERISHLAEAAVEGGAQALTISNTMPGLALDVWTGDPLIRRGIAGYSGPGLHPVVVRLVHQVYRDVARAADVPIIGLGGVMRWEDAAEFILAGASAVGMGTALFADPRSPAGVARGLARWLRRRGAASIGDLVGKNSV
jgi:dihydroorotate dehydrogenase (NAD+) catalytic subunit